MLFHASFRPRIGLYRSATWCLQLATALTLVSAGSVSALPTSIDGVIGPEWSGATVKNVVYNASAPIGNFGTPTNENHEIGYDIYTRGDGSYVYVGLQTTTNYAGGLNFANLYLDTSPGTGSDVGFEVTSERAFIPGVPGYFGYTAGANDIHYALTAGSASAPSVLEFAVPVSFFTSDPLSMGFPPAGAAVQLRLSQSFGYSVAGGGSYGADRLGIVALPEPATALLLGAGLGGFGVVSRRSRRR